MRKTNLHAISRMHANNADRKRADRDDAIRILREQAPTLGKVIQIVLNNETPLDTDKTPR